MKFTWLLISLNIAWALDLQLEAENGQSDSSGTQMYRSTASGGLAVNLRQNGYLVWRFVTSTSCDIVILAVYYSNDGRSDRIEILVDESITGQFTTIGVSQGGHQWNVFRSSGIVGNPVTLSAGQHTLKLIVKMADAVGVEIDSVTLRGPCVVVSSPAQSYYASTNSPSPNTIAAAGGGVTRPTSDGRAGPTDLTLAEKIGISLGVLSLIITTVGLTIAAYKCYIKHCD